MFYFQRIFSLIIKMEKIKKKILFNSVFQTFQVHKKKVLEQSNYLLKRHTQCCFHKYILMLLRHRLMRKTFYLNSSPRKIQ